MTEINKIEFMTAKEASEYLRICTGHLYNLVSKGELVPYKPKGKTKSRLLFSVDKLNEYIGVESGNKERGK